MGLFLRFYGIYINDYNNNNINNNNNNNNNLLLTKILDYVRSIAKQIPRACQTTV